MRAQTTKQGSRGVFTVLILVLGLTFTVVPTVAAATPAEVARASELSFSVPMATFSAATGEKPFDWSSDGCSTPPINDLARWNRTFANPCLRHDFGYRNFGTGGVVANATENQRKKIDDKFRQDMFDVCAPMSFFKRAECRWVAGTYYNVIRAAGRQAFYS